MLANWESAILPRAFPFLPSPPVGIQLVYAIFGICILFGRSLYSLSAWAEKRRLLGEVGWAGERSWFWRLFEVCK